MCPPLAPWTCRYPCWRWDALAGLSSSHTPCPVSPFLHAARSVCGAGWLCAFMHLNCTRTTFLAFSHLWQQSLARIEKGMACYERWLISWLNDTLYLLKCWLMRVSFLHLLMVCSSPLQLPHGLPPASVNLETEVEKQFLRDPAWLPIHDTDIAFQKFLKYILMLLITLLLIIKQPMIAI